MSRGVRVGSLGDRLTEDLRLRIIRGVVGPGDRLVEELLAEEYDVSRGPVRDALKLLDQEGLITRQRKGYVVRGITETDVRELYAVRAAIEVLAIRSLVARAATDVDWRQIAGCLTAMREAADTGDWHIYAQRDLDFHTALYDGSGNSRLRAVWELLRPSFSAMLEVTNAQDVDLHPSCEDHVRLRDALQEGRIEEAVDYLDSHLEGSRARMIRALSQGRR